VKAIAGPFHVHRAQHLGVQLAEDAQHLLRAEADHARAAPDATSPAPAQDLHLGGRAHGGQHGLGIGLDVENIDGRARAMGVRGPVLADQQAGGLQMLLGRLAAVEGGAHLEQRQVHQAARLVARRRLQQPGRSAGRIWLISDEIGFSSRVASSPPPNSAPRPRR
jgi:hypothetical protein